jgi:hypothetical protein
VFQSVRVSAAQEPALWLDNGVIEVAVSTRNGGFAIRTLDGDTAEQGRRQQAAAFPQRRVRHIVHNRSK